jgi:tetratricopeptide (TPR) repeat protein
VSPQREPVEPADPFQAARYLVDEGRPEAAEALLLELIAGMPEGWQPVIVTPKRRLVAAWDMADFLGIVNRAEKGDGRAVVWQGPSYSRAWCEVARIRRARGDLAGALEAVERSLALEPGHPAALLERGLALAALGRGEEAAADRRAVESSDRASPKQREQARNATGNS